MHALNWKYQKYADKKLIRIQTFPASLENAPVIDPADSHIVIDVNTDKKLSVELLNQSYGYRRCVDDEINRIKINVKIFIII